MLGRLLRQSSGTAGVEMALVAPLLIALMFGSMELGYYFYSEHVVVKAVRDGARFASREGFDKYTGCPDDPQADSTLVTNTQNVTRTNQVASGGTARLAGWTDNNSVEVTVSCEPLGTYGSFYEGLTDIPVVTVKATVPYPSLFSMAGFNTAGLTLTAASEAPVMGE
jgi:Flp pilus assembly protein TadG